jgi:hypothetical protein
MYISKIERYTEYKYYYYKFNYYNYKLFEWYKGFFSFWIYTDDSNIVYSDKEKTILDLIYYSLYSKYIQIDSSILEKWININFNLIRSYLDYYPKKSQKRILNKFNNLYK